MPVGPCLYTWWILPNGMSHTDAILRMSSAAVRSSKYRAWYTTGTQYRDGVKDLCKHVSVLHQYQETFCLPCKLAELWWSPFSIVQCLSSRGLPWGDSWQTYTVSLGRTDLQQEGTVYPHSHIDRLSFSVCLDWTRHFSHLDLRALKSLIPSAGPQIWTRSSRVNFNKSEPVTGQSKRLVEVLLLSF